ncbi:MAG: GGDEF domain-containing protein [Lachnospiraceae bacterium]|nr:GGDEF domain-containing protein [Lachnospiraceae bacterium]
MQKKLASLQKFILYGSIDREIYDEARKETDVTNLRTVKRISIQGMLLFFLNALFSLAMYGNNPGFVLNMFSAGTTGIIVFVALGIPETRAKSSLKLVYTFSTFFLFGLLLIDGLIYTRIPSVCFIGCMIIFVVVFTDVPWHLFIISGSASVLLLIFSAVSKPLNIFLVDVMNVIVFNLIALYLCPYMMQIKFADILTRRKIENERDMDALTQLYHKDVVRHTVNETLALSAFHDCALMFLDVDNFKHFNDTFGHAAGDAILKYIADSIRQGCPDIATIGRYGGDEFIAFIPEIDDVQQVRDIAQKILDLVTNRERCLRITDVPDCPSLSIGIAIYPKAGHSYNELVQAADKILYEVKNHGKNNYMVYGDTGVTMIKRNKYGHYSS